VTHFFRGKASIDNMSENRDPLIDLLSVADNLDLLSTEVVSLAVDVS